MLYLFTSICGYKSAKKLLKWLKIWQIYSEISPWSGRAHRYMTVSNCLKFHYRMPLLLSLSLLTWLPAPRTLHNYPLSSRWCSHPQYDKSASESCQLNVLLLSAPGLLLLLLLLTIHHWRHRRVLHAPILLRIYSSSCWLSNQLEKSKGLA